jgi:hypothetical protein
VNLSFPQLLAGSIGALLIYCAIVNKTPVQVMKEALGQQQAGAQPKPNTRPAGTSSGAGSW